MKIHRHYHVAEELQRSEVAKYPNSYRRIVHWVNPDGTLGARLENPQWERLYCGKYHTVMADESRELEREFITALIADNQT